VIRCRPGIVTAIIEETPHIQFIRTEVEGKPGRAVNYPSLTGFVRPGDRVVVNTTAVYLGLGTGGYDYVMHIAGRWSADMHGDRGHIMKLRYTPQQLRVLAVEEQDSPYRQDLLSGETLDGMPVLIGGVHSLVAPAAIGFHHCGGVRGKRRLVYIMTDGGALPLAFSRTVHWLKEQGLIENTVTIGHAFGGDYEAVNIYTGLLTAYNVCHADAVIVAMGPGGVGTGTKYGFSAIEMGPIIDAVNALGGTAIAVPRLTFADSRQRHRGIDHHFLTCLKRATHTPAVIVLPSLPEEQMTYIGKQMQVLDPETYQRVDDECDIVFSEAALSRYRDHLDTMGRALGDTPEFFACAFAAGSFACRLLDETELT